MKVKTIKIMDYYDSKKEIEKFENHNIAYMERLKQNEISISTDVRVVYEINQSVELISISAHFIQFSAFIPKFDGNKELFQRVFITCFLV